MRQYLTTKEGGFVRQPNGDAHLEPNRYYLHHAYTEEEKAEGKRDTKEQISWFRYRDLFDYGQGLPVEKETNA